MTDDAPRTVGVEEELLLLDADDARLVALGDEVAADASRSGAGDFEHEFKQEQAELGTTPCTTAAELAEQLRSRRAALAAAAAGRGARVAALATSPVAGPVHTTATARYARMSEFFGQLAAAQLTCGMHVHVAISSREEGVGVLDRIRPWTAVLTALTTNSPYWSGRDTGHEGYRTVLWGQWPTAGPTEAFGDVATYDAVRASLVASGAALDEGMLYFDARLSRRYPTVELRVCDVSPFVEDAVLAAVLARGLVSRAAADAADGRPAPVLRAEVMRAAAWHAARWGVEDELLDVRSAAAVPAWTMVDALVDEVADHLSPGDADVLADGLAAIRRRGTGARLQRETSAAAGSLDAVVDAVAEATLA